MWNKYRCKKSRSRWRRTGDRRCISAIQSMAARPLWVFIYYYQWTAGGLDMEDTQFCLRGLRIQSSISCSSTAQDRCWINSNITEDAKSFKLFIFFLSVLCSDWLFRNERLHCTATISKAEKKTWHLKLSFMQAGLQRTIIIVVIYLVEICHLVSQRFLMASVGQSKLFASWSSVLLNDKGQQNN